MPYSLSNKLIIETPENTFLEFEVAGLSSRFMAYLIDTFVQVLIVYLFYYLALIIAAIVGASTTKYAFSNVVIAILVLVVFVVFQGYFIFFEVYWNGQSIGKKLLNLRVVKERGYPIVFMDSLIRNILRFADMLPPLYFFPSYGIGSLSIIFSPQSRRVGDYLAGTIVIREQRSKGFAKTPLVRIGSQLPASSRLRNLQRLSEFEIYLVREFFYRKNMVERVRRNALAVKLVAHLTRKLKISDVGQDPIQFLSELMLIVKSKSE